MLTVQSALALGLAPGSFLEPCLFAPWYNMCRKAYHLDAWNAISGLHVLINLYKSGVESLGKDL